MLKPTYWFISSFSLMTSFWMSPCFASFDMAPIIASVSPTGPGATASFTITNSSDSKTPIQVTIYRREPDIDGKEKYEDAKDSGEMFQIFPAQLILNPKEKRTMRVTYVGEQKLTKELAFRIIAEEFPINVSDPKKVTNKAVASIAVMTKYVGSLYVTPVGVQPELSITTTQTKGTSGTMMVLNMENKGTEHQLLKAAKYTILTTSDGKTYPMPQESVSAIGNQNILAGHTRKFTIPWPKGIPTGPVKVTLDLAKK